MVINLKKILFAIAALSLLLCLPAPFRASAASAGATLTGPGTVRAGDTITLTFALSGSGLYGATGTLSYNTDQLTLTGTKQVIASPWMVEFNGNYMVAYDNNMDSPISSSKNLFTVSFKVKDVTAGTTIMVSYTDVTASDGSADAKIGTVSYRVTVSPPLSGNHALASLTVSNADISPAFHANTTDYTASVPFSVSKLDVQATAADSKAKVSISSPTLTPNGKTNVTVTVTAENGATRTYTIEVYREQDPNYVPSGNNDLSDITVEGFLLSPVFRADVTEYVVWLPYETESVRVSGKAADSKAAVQIVGGEDLLAGQDNTVKVICTAENGDTKEYILTVKRAAAHGSGTEPVPTETATPTPEATQTPNADATPTAAPEITPTPVPGTTAGNTEPEKTGGIPWWLLLIVGLVCLGAGFGIGMMIEKKKSERENE